MKLWSQGRSLAIQKVVLPLSSSSHKGSSGRVAVLGGNARYTGAPYYAAMACLKTGADLAYVFTAQEAAVPIKCYSPELMVAPVYSAAEFDRVQNLQSEAAERLINDMVDQVVDSMERLHCLIIGPGLGRCPLVFRAVSKIVQAAKQQSLDLVLDADALYMLSLPEYATLLQGYDKAVLTPNVVEHKRLIEGSTDLEAVTVVQKGKHDQILRGDEVVHVCEEEGGLKRSGGIGDILAGTVGALIAWNRILRNEERPLACWAACCFVKRGTYLAYAKHRRSMTAPNVLEHLGAAIDDMTTE